MTPRAYLLTTLVLVLACNVSRPATSIQTKADTPPVVTIVATDYAYEAPDTVQSGVNVFRLVNHGEQPHAATIVRLDSGKTLPDYIQAYGEANRTRGARPTWAKFRGGPAALMRGGEGTALLNLEPGNYAWVCFVPVPDGVSHVLQHNQAHAFVVRPRSGATAAAIPEPTVTLRLLDYSFALSAPLKAGKHTIRVLNAGADYHHALLFKLVPGKTIQDFQAWQQNQMQGEGPSTYVAAIGELSSGADAYLELDLTAGDYVLVCLISGRDEVAHVTKGMVQHIRVG